MRRWELGRSICSDDPHAHGILDPFDSAATPDIHEHVRVHPQPNAHTDINRYAGAYPNEYTGAHINRYTGAHENGGTPTYYQTFANHCRGRGRWNRLEHCGHSCGFLCASFWGNNPMVGASRS